MGVSKSALTNKICIEDSYISNGASNNRILHFSNSRINPKLRSTGHEVFHVKVQMQMPRRDNILKIALISIWTFLSSTYPTIEVPLIIKRSFSSVSVPWKLFNSWASFGVTLTLHVTSLKVLNIKEISAYFHEIELKISLRPRAFLRMVLGQYCYILWCTWKSPVFSMAISACISLAGEQT